MCFFSISHVAFSIEIPIATINWPPYTSETFDHNGFICEIVEMACKEGQLSPSFKFMPIKRASHYTKKGKFAAVFPYTDKDRDSFLLSDPFGGSALVFFKNKNTPAIPYKSIEDLKPYRIGIVLGHTYTKGFDEATYLNKDTAGNLEMCFKKLDKNRVDIVIADKFAATELLKSEFSKTVPQIEQIDPPFAIRPFYVAFSKNYPNVKNILHQFNIGLRKIKRDGSVNRVLEKHGFFTMSSKSLSPDELERFVKKGLDYVNKVGLDKAIVEFKKKKGLFSKGELYIFVIDMEGNMLSHIYQHLVGNNVMNMQDKLGFYLIKEFTKVIKEKGSGWVEYWWPNPVLESGLKYLINPDCFRKHCNCSVYFA